MIRPGFSSDFKTRFWWFYRSSEVVWDISLNGGDTCDPFEILYVPRDVVCVQILQHWKCFWPLMGVWDSQVLFCSPFYIFFFISFFWKYLECIEITVRLRAFKNLNPSLSGDKRMQRIWQIYFSREDSLNFRRILLEFLIDAFKAAMQKWEWRAVSVTTTSRVITHAILNIPFWLLLISFWKFLTSK